MWVCGGEGGSFLSSFFLGVFCVCSFVCLLGGELWISFVVLFFPLSCFLFVCLFDLFWLLLLCICEILLDIVMLFFGLTSPSQLTERKPSNNQPAFLCTQSHSDFSTKWHVRHGYGHATPHMATDQIEWDVTFVCQCNMIVFHGNMNLNIKWARRTPSFMNISRTKPCFHVYVNSPAVGVVYFQPYLFLI